MNADMTKILQEIAVALRAFLGRTLPGIRTDWWAALVIAVLVLGAVAVRTLRSSAT